MTLGRLMELYQAEQQGKQIMLREYRCRNFKSYEHIEEIKISECELSTFVLEDDADGFDGFDYDYTYFIKDEEDEYGNKLNEQNLQ